MTTATATINGNTIEGEAAFIAEVLLKMSEPVKEAAGKVEISEEDAEQLTFKELTFELIKPEFGDQLAQQIVDKLEYAAIITTDLTNLRECIVRWVQSNSVNF